jgi:phage/plasmid-like protein (TIGR03299 family)
MSHRVHSMAFVGETPWHGLGNELEAGATIDEWRVGAGMDWTVQETPIFHKIDRRQHPVPGMKALVRSDTLETLSVMSDRYKPVQPREILEFYDSLTAQHGFVLHTAGVLDNGRRLWALAETGKDLQLKGKDKVACFLLLATSMDGTLATRAMFTSIRVVCNNTLSFAYRSANGSKDVVSIRHNTKFDAGLVKSQLGLDDAWSSFAADAAALSQRKVAEKEVKEFIYRVMGDAKLEMDKQSDYTAKCMNKVLALYNGDGRGAGLSSAKGTAWGLVNAVTEYADHHARAHSDATRLNNAWFGTGELMKRAAMSEALLLV